MRPQLILAVTLAVLGVLAAMAPLGEGSSWPCCDDCGICNRKFPPECKCNDVSAHGCHPECKKCVRVTLTADDNDGGVQKRHSYHCADMLTNFCKSRCTPATAAGAFLGEVF